MCERLHVWRKPQKWCDLTLGGGGYGVLLGTDGISQQHGKATETFKVQKKRVTIRERERERQRERGGGARRLSLRLGMYVPWVSSYPRYLYLGY